MKIRPILRLLTGRAGTGKTTRCIELFRDRILKSDGSGLNSSSYFVLPNKEHTDRIHDLLTRDARVAGLVQHHLLPIGDFVRFKCWTGRDRVVTQFERRWLVRRVLEAGSWKWMARSAKTPGMADCMANWLRELKNSGVGLEQFMTAGKLLEGSGSDPDKVRDLTVFYEAYESLKRMEGYRDPEEAVDGFARESELLAQPDMDLVILDGFFSLTERQIDFLGAAGGRSREVWVTLTIPADAARADAFLYPVRLREKLLGLGFVEERMAEEPKRFRSAGLKHLESTLFAGKPSETECPTEGVRCVEAATRRQEVEAIARSAIENVRSGRCHWSDQMAVFRSVLVYQPYIEEVFGAMKVPYELHERRRLSEHPAVRRMLEWLDLVEARGVTETDGPEGAEKTLLIRIHRWALWMDSSEVFQALDALPARLEWAQVPEHFAGLSDDAKDLWARERERLRQFLELDSAKAFKSFLEKMFDVCAGERTLPATRRAGDMVLELIQKQAVRAIDGRDAVRAAVERLRGDLESGLYSTGSRRKNRVQIYDTALALPKEYRIVYVGGLNHGDFPVVHREHPVLSDTERKALRAAGISLDTAEDRRKGEAFFFYMAVTRASEEVILTRFTADDEGRPAHASDWWAAAQAVFWGNIPCRKIEADDLVPCAEHIKTPKDLSLALGLSLLRENGSAAETGALGAAWDRLGEEERTAAGCPETSGPLAERAGRLLKPASIDPARLAKDAFTRRKPWSATEAQTIRQCRFLYFVKYGIGIKPPIQTTAEMREGEIWHKALEILMKNWFGVSRIVPPLDKFLASADRALAEALQGYPPVAERFYLQTARMERMRRRWPRVAESEWNNLKATQKLLPAFFEAGFGLVEDGVPSDKPAFAVEAGGERLEFQGKIDRIDTDPVSGRAMAADYKSGKGFAPAELKKGMRFQAVLYTLALEKVWGFKPIGTEYVSLKTFKRGGLLREDYFRDERPETRLKSLMSPEDFSAFLQQEVEALASDWKSYRAGDIAAISKSCQYCDFYSMCRYEKRRQNK